MSILSSASGQAPDPVALVVSSSGTHRAGLMPDGRLRNEAIPGAGSPRIAVDADFLFSVRRSRDWRARAKRRAGEASLSEANTRSFVKMLEHYRRAVASEDFPLPEPETAEVG